MMLRHLVITILFACAAVSVATAQDPQRAALARQRGKQLTVTESKTTPDGKRKWIDHAEVYNAEGQLIEEAEYGDYGTRLVWRSEYQYNERGQVVKELVYNERNKISKIRTFEYDANGICIRRMNYDADGKLNSYRQYEYTFK